MTASSSVSVSFHRSRRALQLVLIGVALLPVTTGPLAFWRGARAIPGARRWDGPVDGEVRYLSVWWTAAGLMLLRAVPGVEREAGVVRSVSVLVALGGLGRVRSMRREGLPHPLMMVAAVVEVLLPFVVIPWQRRIARRAA